MSERVVIFTGGTGGHVIPAVNFGNFLLSKGFECILILDKRGFKYINDFSGQIYILDSSHLSGNVLFKIKSLISLSIFFIKSVYLLIKIKPSKCISFGSYATFMPLLSILILRFFIKIKIYLHEQNSVIGKVNLFFLPYAKYIFSNFENIKNLKSIYKHKKFYVGLPSKLNIKPHNFKINKNHKKENIFLYGGSQGSLSLINIFLSIIERVNKNILNNLKLFIQAPETSSKIIGKKLKALEIDFEIKSFYQNIDEILSITDIAITRAGSGTINDLIYFKIPSMILPLPQSIYNHQYYNAKFLSDKKGAILLDEKNINIDKIVSDFNKLIIDYNLRRNMKQVLESIYIPDSNKLILEKIFYE